MGGVDSLSKGFGRRVALFSRGKKAVSFFSRQSVRKQQTKRGSGGRDWDVTHCLDLRAVSFPLMALSPAFTRLSGVGGSEERLHVRRPGSRSVSNSVN